MKKKSSSQKIRQMFYVLLGITLSISLAGCVTNEFSEYWPLAVILASIAVFLVIREVICWFYKTNAIIEELNTLSHKIVNPHELDQRFEEIKQEINKLNKNLEEIKEQLPDKNNTCATEEEI